MTLHHDWISPLIAALDGRKDIYVDVPAGWSAWEVMRYLRKNGVKANLPQAMPGGNTVIAVSNKAKAQRLLDELR